MRRRRRKAEFPVGAARPDYPRPDYPQPDFPKLDYSKLGESGPVSFERAFWRYGLEVVGIDEAGRGPLAGPVVAAAVVLKEGAPVDGARDSKEMTREERKECHEGILARSSFAAAGAASAKEIDRYDIVGATAKAMRRALQRLPRSERRHVVIDGLPMRRLGVPHDAVVKGDALVHSISCASVVAKVTRDKLMRRLARRYPGYGWRSNVGYGTREHKAALERLGPTPHHRLTFLGLQHEIELRKR